MTSQPAGPAPSASPGTAAQASPGTPAQALPAQAPPGHVSTPGHVDVVLRSFGQPNSARRQFDFLDDSYEWRRVFSELFGTFLLVLVAAGGGMVNARFGSGMT
jgi:hypothetical protein